MSSPQSPGGEGVSLCHSPTVPTTSNSIAGFCLQFSVLCVPRHTLEHLLHSSLYFVMCAFPCTADIDALPHCMALAHNDTESAYSFCNITCRSVQPRRYRHSHRFCRVCSRKNFRNWIRLMLPRVRLCARAYAMSVARTAARALSFCFPHNHSLHEDE